MALDNYKLILLNQHLAGRRFLGGKEPSKADISMFSLVEEFIGERSERKVPKALFNLKKWLESMHLAQREAPEEMIWPGEIRPNEYYVASWPNVFVNQIITELDSLLLAASVTNVEYSRKQYLLNNGDFEFSAKNENIVFRHYISDLHSVLDYITVLMYCHYKNNGQPDYSHDGLSIKFPFTDELEHYADDVAIPAEDALKTQRNNFVKKHLETIFGCTEFPSEKHSWFAKKIEKLQAHTVVSASGKKSFEKLEDGSDKQVFNQLHFFHHYCSHLCLISTSPEPGHVHMCVCNYPTVEMTPHDCHFEDCKTKIPLSKGLFVSCPDDPRSPSEIQGWPLKPILTIAGRFLYFVKILRDDILKNYFNLPPFDKVNIVRSSYDDGFHINQHFIPWNSFQIHRPVPIH